jgi:hypothetical protein
MTTKSPIKETRPGRLGIIAAAFLVAFLPAAPLTAQDDTGAQAPSPITAESLGLPKVKTAYNLSLWGTLGSYGLLLAYSVASSAEGGGSTIASVLGYAGLAGIMIGPSLGNFYGGLWGRGLLLTGLRVGTSVAVIAYTMYHDESDNTAVAVLWLSTLIGSTIYECATVKSAVRKHNAARLAKRNLKVAVAPFAVRRGAGLSVQLSF